MWKYSECPHLLYRFLLYMQSRQSAELFLQSLELGLPHPHDRRGGECALPPLILWGRGALACGRGGGWVPISTRGHTLWYSMYICTLWFYLLLQTDANYSRFLAWSRKELPQLSQSILLYMKASANEYSSVLLGWLDAVSWQLLQR